MEIDKKKSASCDVINDKLDILEIVNFGSQDFFFKRLYYTISNSLMLTL